MYGVRQLHGDRRCCDLRRPRLISQNRQNPEFQRMIKDSYKHAIQAAIVRKSDKFTRNRYDSAYYKTTPRKNRIFIGTTLQSDNEIRSCYFGALAVNIA